MAGGGGLRSGVNLDDVNVKVLEIMKNAEDQVNELLNAANPGQEQDTAVVFEMQKAMQQLSIAASVATSVSKAIYDTLRGMTQKIP